MAVVPAAEAGRTEIATGKMLGSGYTKGSFYVRAPGGAWQPTYSERGYASAARGKLMNFRAANAIFDDEHRSDDDPNANTEEFVSHLDAYKAHGVLAYTVSLQGGNPGYEGANASAFRNDGSLKDSWMRRAARVIEAADAHGQVVIMTYFYQRQDQRLASNDAVRRAVDGATDWLIARNYRNVIIEIANEWNSPGWDRSILTANSTSGGVAELINRAKGRFAGRGYRLPVSVSGRGLDFSGAIRDAADLALVHGNLTSPSSDGDGIAELVADPRVNGPVVMNEDRNGDAVTATNLLAEKAAATAVFNAGGSWGLMWRRYCQFYPFKWALGPSTDISGSSESNYFHAVLEHIASLVLADKSPHDVPVDNPGGGAPTADMAVSGFTLLDADADAEIMPLRDGGTVDLSALPSRRLNVRADTAPATVGSVRFGLDGDSDYRVENGAPYALAGNSGGDYFAWTPSVGTHTITATPYSASGGTGTAGRQLSIKFTVSDRSG
jgi:hypothetical protein